MSDPATHYTWTEPARAQATDLELWRSYSQLVLSELLKREHVSIGETVLRAKDVADMMLAAVRERFTEDGALKDPAGG